jgi:hypothetical protein
VRKRWLPGIAALALLAEASLRQVIDFGPPPIAVMGEDAMGYYVRVDLRGRAFDYACLTSGGYRQMYIDPAYQCWECEHDPESRDIEMAAAEPDGLIAVRHGDAMLIEHVRDLETGRDAVFMGRIQTAAGVDQYLTYYGNGLGRILEPMKARNLSQCTTRAFAVARCHTFGDRCYFAFGGMIQDDD